MTVHRPGKYIDFIAYCNKRKAFCKDYQHAKAQLFNGELHIDDYFKYIKSIQQAAIELELQYFDVLHMRIWGLDQSSDDLGLTVQGLVNRTFIGYLHKAFPLLSIQFSSEF